VQHVYDLKQHLQLAIIGHVIDLYALSWATGQTFMNDGFVCVSLTHGIAGTCFTATRYALFTLFRLSGRLGVHFAWPNRPD